MTRPANARRPDAQLLAVRVEGTLDRLRNAAERSARRRWRPFWSAGYRAGLRDAHQETQAVIVRSRLWYPTDPHAPIPAGALRPPAA